MTDVLLRFDEISSELDQCESGVSVFFDLSGHLLLALMDRQQFVHVSERWTEVLGWLPEELKGKYWYDIVHPDDMNRCEVKLAEMEQSSTKGWVGRFRHKNGTYLWFEFASTTWDQQGLAFGISRQIDAPE